MAHRRLRPLMGAGHRCLGIQLRSHVVDSWAGVFVHGRLFLFMGMHFHCWASAFVGGRSCSCGGGEVESWWPFVMEWLVAWLLQCVVVVRCCLAE